MKHTKIKIWKTKTSQQFLKKPKKKKTKKM